MFQNSVAGDLRWFAVWVLFSIFFIYSLHILPGKLSLTEFPSSNNSSDNNSFLGASNDIEQEIDYHFERV